MTKSLDLGSGRYPKNTFNADELYGIDIQENLGNDNVRCADLVIEPIPFDDDTFEFVTAHDFLEHIPRVVYAPKRRNSFVEVMNEIHRVLKPGGTFLSLTPAFPQAAVFRSDTRQFHYRRNLPLVFRREEPLGHNLWFPRSLRDSPAGMARPLAVDRDDQGASAN